MNCKNKIQLIANRADVVLLQLTAMNCVHRLKEIILLFSELGQRFSNSFIEIDDAIGQLDWYLFPIGIQRLLPITIMNVQQPVVID